MSKTNHTDKPELAGLTLGKTTEYQSQYNAGLLQGVPRSLNRAEFGIVEQQPFIGCDVWHGYELSWLNTKGKPVVALARFIFDASSENIVESKSFKLYLNSFNQTRFASTDEVRKILIKDLSATAGVQAQVELFTADQRETFQVTELPGFCLDDLDIEVGEFSLNPDVLALDKSSENISETLHSHLLKSNCLITNQPDWATVVIEYEGAQINKESLLRYLVSFRMHNEFHEQCVERIFMDIQKYCSPEKLSVQAFYTRRGGLDINPYRSSKEGKTPFRLRVNRQ